MSSLALPPYSVRVSDRARRARLSISARHGLVVVVPRGFRGEVDSLVRQKRAWAEKHLAAIADRRALYAAGHEALLPHQIELTSVAVAMPVDYVATPSATVRAVTKDGVLRLSGDIDDASACLRALRRWLAREAEQHLVPLCLSLGETHHLMPSRVRITAARSRWGSCSSAGTISLNRNLMFLPPELVESLICHELAHLQVMNHSPRFWSALEKLDSSAHLHRSRMSKAGDLVPVWADA